jgi:hypothetical protein
MGTTKFFAHVPSLLTLELFWPFKLLCKIVMETNRYASYVLDALGNNRRNPKMDANICGGIEGISSNPHVHGYEAPTKHQIILEQGGLHFPLFNYF